jgi:hypothetical protein
MSANKATIIFTDNNDGGLEVQITFEPDQLNKESNAHVAAVLAHQYIVKKVEGSYTDEPA